MKPAFYSGASGLIAHQENMNTIGHNISNVNTIGYKAQTTTFDDLLYNRMYANTDTDPYTGHGVKAVAAGMKFGQGHVRQTMFNLDFAIVGDAFFAIDKNGQTQYTRDGELAIRMEGETAYLAAQDGSYILDSAGNSIELQKLAGKDEYDIEAARSAIGLYRFNNPGALTPINGNRYSPTDESGAAQLVNDGSSRILSGYVENSGVDISDEMTNMIAAQRAYQLSARVVQVSDENEQTINNLRR